MRRLTKADFVELLESGQATRESIIQLGNWVIAWIGEGSEDKEVVYVEV